MPRQNCLLHQQLHANLVYEIYLKYTFDAALHSVACCDILTATKQQRNADVIASPPEQHPAMTCRSVRSNDKPDTRINVSCQDQAIASFV